MRRLIPFVSVDAANDWFKENRSARVLQTYLKTIVGMGGRTWRHTVVIEVDE